MTDLIEIDKYPVRDVLSLLLKDKTTGKNIIFATDTYSGYGYAEHDYMTETAVLGFSSCDIQPRVFKTQSEQNERTRKKAEVFTPAWVCNMMAGDFDFDWFGCEEVFNRQVNQGWKTKTEKIKFPENKNWQMYVDSRCLEITCGEAPYIVSRYDATTGEVIPVNERIGILDRKLRVVSENTVTEDEWMKWVVRAYQSVYGYEFQGDNLLIARVNLLLSFSEYLEYNWHRKATKPELRKIANIIVWNIWQMDGLSDTVPAFNLSDCVQMTFFEEKSEEHNEVIFCKVKDWRKECSFIFKDLKDRKRGKKMKFDYIIGNPPYQEDTNGAGKQARPIYNYFVESAKELSSDSIVMIIPSRWFSGGMGLDKFRETMMNDSCIIKLVDYTNAKDCFPNISISGGVCVFVRNNNNSSPCQFINITNGIKTQTKRYLNEFPTLVRYNDAVSIIHKVLEKNEEKLEDIISSLMPFGLSTKYRGRNKKTDIDNLTLHASNGITYISENEISKGYEYVDKYKILISKTSAEHAGEPSSDGKFRVIPSSLKVLKPKEVCTHSYFLIGCWDDEINAANALTYLSTKFVRFLMLMCISGFGLSKLVFTFVPIQDFSKPWTDDELYNAYQLTTEEIKFIDNIIKPM